MRGLNIASDLSLPFNTETATLIVYGGKGMGKTNFGSVLVEELTKAKLRWSTLDPLGVWYGLRHSKDGNDKGIECLILGGMHGDIPIEPTGGAVVADLVVDEPVNVIIDFSRRPNGQMWSMGEKIRFVTDYAVRLFQRQGEIVNGRRREPLFQILDESARYIPQIIPSGAIDLAKCVGAWEQIVEEGRNVGLGVGLLTQRSARMNKSVSELADAMIAFRIVGPRSIEAVTDWLGEHIEKARLKEAIETVRKLDVGSALVVSPGWLKTERVVHIRERETFDSSATPKAGEHRRVPKHAAKPDLEKYRERMAETIERAEANDVGKLKQKIVELNKQLAKPRAELQAAWDGEELKKDFEEIMANFRRSTVEKARDLFKEISEALNTLCDTPLASVGESVRQIRAKLAKINPDLVVPPVPKTGLLRPRGKTALLAVDGPAPFTVMRSPKVGDRINVNGTSQAGPNSLGAGTKMILNAIAMFDDGVDREQLFTLTGYKGTSIYTYLKDLRAKGYIDGDLQGRIRATSEGTAALGSEFRPLPTGDALYEWWLGRLGEGERKVVTIIHDERETTREAIKDATGYKDTSVYTYLKALRARRLIEMGANGVVKAAEALYG